jgi:4-aminobutyrate aminotransferase/(S)-3-amino-2-methylpropionate transaminase
MHCLERFERFFTVEAAPETIAALIIEPIQGEGGFLIPPKEFLPGLKSICEKHGILFIADEIQTGFGRTGKMFAVEHWGVEPDMMTVAKSMASGMPLSGVVGKAEIMDAPDPGNVGGTYGGNPLACVAGLETIKYIEENRLADRAQAIGKTVMDKMATLQEKYEIIGDVRGIGAMIAIELVKNRQTKEPAKEITAQIVKACYKRGLIIISAGIFGNVIRMLMPLVITDEQLDEALGILEEAFDEVVEYN